MEGDFGKTISGNDVGNLENNLTANSLVFSNTGFDLTSVSTGGLGQVLVQGVGGVDWLTVSGTGTVTSIGVSVPSFLSVSPSTITGAGTFAISGTSTGSGSVVVLNVGPSLSSVVLSDLSASTLVYANGSKQLVSVASGGIGQVLTAGSGGTVSWSAVNTNWESPGTIGSSVANTGKFTSIEGTGILKMVQSYTTIAYVSNSMTFTADKFSTGMIKFTGVASATTITLDTAVNFVAQFGSVVGSCFVGHFVYVSTSGSARAITWAGGTGVTIYTPTGGNNSYHEQWTIVITSASTIDFFAL